MKSHAKVIVTWLDTGTAGGGKRRHGEIKTQVKSKGGRTPGQGWGLSVSQKMLAMAHFSFSEVATILLLDWKHI